MLKSIKKLNIKLYFSLVVMALVPTLYTTFRIFLLGTLANDYSYSIAGQLSWVNLIYEIFNEAIILPLFYFVGKSVEDKLELSGKIKTGLIIISSIYVALFLIILGFAPSLLKLMATSPDIIKQSATYIRIESFANIFGIVLSFLSVCLISIGMKKEIYVMTGLRLILCLCLDSVLVSNLKFSLKLGVNGIGVSNVIINFGLSLFLIIVLIRRGYLIKSNTKLDWHWTKEFLSKGTISGVESLVRNVAYMLMVSRMVNMVGEQGVYWVANNFIWGFLLLPILQLGELIKQEVSINRQNAKTHLKSYLSLTTIICVIWIILIPLYKPFMKNILLYNDVAKLFKLVIILLVFYIMFAYQNIFDMIFYGSGKVSYMLFESVVTNTIYYGTFFVLWQLGIFKPSLMSIALMFGFGNMFDSVVSYLAFRVYMRNANAS